ncbi:HRDC domain-containing protein [Flavobacteriales bacterium]|nr:HRDC domain-containing protein [Flavobacteriales bacterium]
MVQLANQGALEILYSENSSLKMTEIGWKIVKGEKKIQMTRPVQLKDKETLKKKKPVKIISSNEVNNDLFEDLRKLRSTIAKEENVPAYIVFGDKTLKEMAAELPTTENEFLAISGVGMNKMEQFGEEFMEVIRKYKNEKQSNPKTKKVPTTLTTFYFYKQGFTPDQIAEKRDLQLMTVYSHLSQLYSEGKEVNLAKFVTPEIIKKVKVAFDKNERKFELKPIFEALDEEVPYHEIRIALALILRDE